MEDGDTGAGCDHGIRIVDLHLRQHRRSPSTCAASRGGLKAAQRGRQRCASINGGTLEKSTVGIKRLRHRQSILARFRAADKQDASLVAEVQAKSKVFSNLPRRCGH